MRLYRSLRKRYLKLVDAQSVTISGVTLDSGKGRVPDDVRDALFRDTYEDTERKLLLTVLKPGMKVLEIGAGIGFIGLLAAKIVGEENVWSYEANPLLEPMIRRNYALNGVSPNLTMKAVTLDGAPVTFFRSENIISSSIYDRERGDQQIAVESVALPSVVADRDPDVIIMDVEGAEVDLLSLPLTPRIRHLIVELHPHIVGPEKISSLISDLTSHGFAIESRDRKTVHLQRA